MFPQTNDPVSKLKDRGIPVKMILLQNDSFTEEILQLGFRDMKHQGREKWLGAIKAQTFCLQKTTVGTWVPVGDVISLDPKEVSVAVITVAADIGKVFSPANASSAAPDQCGEVVPGKGLEVNDDHSDSNSDDDSSSDSDNENEDE